LATRSSSSSTDSSGSSFPRLISESLNGDIDVLQRGRSVTG
jgi:hypothetical protein